MYLSYNIYICFVLITVNSDNLTEFMHGIGADRYVYFYLAVEV